jgi:hypothetical protein
MEVSHASVYCSLRRCVFRGCHSFHRSAGSACVAEKDGYRFEYTSELTPAGLVRFSGRSLERDGPFDLTMDQKGRVTGEVDGTPVKFSVGKAKRDRIVAGLATSSARAELASAAHNPPAAR